MVDESGPPPASVDRYHYKVGSYVRRWGSEQLGQIVGKVVRKGVVRLLVRFRGETGPPRLANHNELVLTGPPTISIDGAFDTSKFRAKSPTAPKSEPKKLKRWQIPKSQRPPPGLNNP